MQYKTKPVVVDAVRYHGDNMREVEKLTGSDDIARSFVGEPGIPMLSFRQDGKPMHVSKGDWVVKRAGRLDVVSDVEFLDTYEPLEQQRG